MSVDFSLPILAAANANDSDIPLWLIGPFVLLLLLIAIMPLASHGLKHLWERFYPHVSLFLGALIAAHYLVRIPGGGLIVEHTAIEYVSFIVLIGALFVVSGGIHLTVKGEATPRENVVFLAVGAVLANFIGTTGASMVLIRPWIRMNRERIRGYHIVFFIFLVSNVGGALTPIGDPPLFLGYLRGVPFFWLIEHVSAAWGVTVVALLAVFFVFDRTNYAHTSRAFHRKAENVETWKFQGAINLLFMMIVMGAVFLPARYFLREAVMIGAAAASYFLTPREIHERNGFGFGPIKEVAFLFAGIFLTMMPALGYLERHGAGLGIAHPLQYYFATGGLSAVLDNAPTYVNFLQLALTTTAAQEPTLFAAVKGDPIASVRLLLVEQPGLVVAVSLGAVFFGAMTYIGNGPNFMVKSIAESAGVKTPTFFGYLGRYALPILLPILIALGFVFVR